MSTTTSELHGPGRVAGIARRPARRAPMELIDEVVVASGGGLDGDHKGLKFPRRGVTILAREDWDAALAALAASSGDAGVLELPWTTRRANLLVEGVRLPRSVGAILAVGDIRLEVTAQTYPCRRMEQVRPGLMKALAPAWRGGVSCRVITGGTVRLGETLSILQAPREPSANLP